MGVYIEGSWVYVYMIWWRKELQVTSILVGIWLAMLVLAQNGLVLVSRMLY